MPEQNFTIKTQGFVHILLVIFLLVGIAVTVYLVGKQTNLLPKAFAPKPTGPETSFSLFGQGDCVGFFCPGMPQKDPLPGEEFEVKLFVRSDIDEANLFQAKMKFPVNLVEVTGIKTDNGFIKNWVENFYDNNTGEISLAGGVPSPGFQTKLGGESALMATIVFKAKTGGTGTVLFNDDSAIYRNTDNADILKIKREYDISIGTKPSPTPTPTPSPSPLPKDYLVKSYLVYPADKPVYPEYETAVNKYLVELQNWYKGKVGVTFTMAPLQIVKSQYNYDIMRCDPSPFDQTPPSRSCLSDPKKLEGNWGMYMNLAIHNGVERWDEKTATLVFSAGGGGYAGSNKYGNDAGWAITGDWVLEPISGKANDWGIPCKYSDGWQCAGGVPGGSPAHELGHAFGLPHPDEQKYPGERVSIMRWHGDYPQVGFLPHEVEFLKNSPFFNASAVPSPSPSPTPTSTPLPLKKGDGNKDGKINLVDMSVLLSHWNKGDLAEIEMNDDGKINTFDFSLHRKLLIDLGVIKGQ